MYPRHLLKVGNRDLYGRDFAWFLDRDLANWQQPLHATVIERREWGNFFGFPQKLLERDKVVAEGDALWSELVIRIDRANDIHDAITEIEKTDIGRINKGLEKLRLEKRKLELSGATAEQLSAFLYHPAFVSGEVAIRSEPSARACILSAC